MHYIARKILGYAPGFIRRHFMRKYEGQLKQIIILRTDLKMRRGKEIAQGAHASMGAFLKHKRDPFVQTWLEGAFAKIAVGVDSESELLEIHNAAKDARIPHVLITDAGRTEFKGVQTHTAVCIGPADPDLVRELTGHLKLR